MEGLESDGGGGLPGVPDCSDDFLGPPGVANAGGFDAVAVDREMDTRMEPSSRMPGLRSSESMGVTIVLGACEVADVSCDIAESGFIL